MRKLVDLKDLLIEQIRDLYNSEKQLVEAVSDLHKKATDVDLKRILSDYLLENEDQIMRLEQVFSLLYVEPVGEVCEAMRAMIHESRDLVGRSVDPEVLDAGLITAIQHINHYQIAGYGAACTYAKMLGLLNAASIIHKNLEVEKKTDRILAQLAEEVVNQRAKYPGLNETGPK